MWFETLMGFEERSRTQVHKNIKLEGHHLVSLVNGKSYQYGHLEIPTLKDLRQQLQTIDLPKGKLTLTEIVGNVQHLHTYPENAGAFFQAASQFNLLEMASPNTTPEEGVGIYQYDRTQGPACAIAAGAGTIYRNYFVEIDEQIGQTATHQVDCLDLIGQTLGNENNNLWRMKNGYAWFDKNGLETIDQKLQSMDEHKIDELRQQLKIGLQWDTQITLNNATHLVTQAYCSALPVAYVGFSNYLWANFAKLILEASYEATLIAAAINYEKTKNPKVYLTLVGGGVFGNSYEWIFSAMKRAISLFKDCPLEVEIVSYGSSKSMVRDFISSF